MVVCVVFNESVNTHPEYKVEYEQQVFDNRADIGEVLAGSRRRSATSPHVDMYPVVLFNSV